MVSSNGETLFLIGSSHHTAPLEFREKIALAPDAMESIYQQLTDSPDFRECLILNTCNRVEIYGVSPQQNVRNQMLRLFSKHNGIDTSILDQFAFWKTNEAVVQHAFEVAAGLDSQMVGETEILGQVKGSFSSATERKTLGPVLNRVFQKSFQAAKWARTNTGIGKGQVSIGNVATDLAIRVCGELKNSNILTIGSGEVGEKTTQALVSRGANQITIANRNLEKARKLADMFEGAAIQLSSVRQKLHKYDIVISCTAAKNQILTLSDIEQALKQRPTRPLFLIDLAVPRDIAEDVVTVQNVYLYNVDHLAKIANENLKARLSDMEICRNALTEKANHVWNAILQRQQHTQDTSQ